jgi:hypothetical protein
VPSLIRLILNSVHGVTTRLAHVKKCRSWCLTIALMSSSIAFRNDTPRGREETLPEAGSVTGGVGCYG